MQKEDEWMSYQVLAFSAQLHKCWSSACYTTARLATGRVRANVLQVNGSRTSDVCSENASAKTREQLGS
jgi:hypothetical protein